MPDTFMALNCIIVTLVCSAGTGALLYRLGTRVGNRRGHKACTTAAVDYLVVRMADNMYLPAYKQPRNNHELLAYYDGIKDVTRHLQTNAEQTLDV